MHTAGRNMTLQCINLLHFCSPLLICTIFLWSLDFQRWLHTSGQQCLGYRIVALDCITIFHQLTGIEYWSVGVSGHRPRASTPNSAVDSMHILRFGTTVDSVVLLDITNISPAF